MHIQKPADLARIVKTRRQSQGLTQQDVADAVGITRQSLARIERGHAGASFDLVLRVFEKLGIRLEVNSDRQQTVAVPIPTGDSLTSWAATSAVPASAREIDTSAITAALAAATRNIDTSALTVGAYNNLDVSAIAAAATAATRGINSSALLSNWQSDLKNLTRELRGTASKSGSEFSAQETRKAILSAAIEAGNPDRKSSTPTSKSSSPEALSGGING